MSNLTRDAPVCSKCAQTFDLKNYNNMTKTKNPKLTKIETFQHERETIRKGIVKAYTDMTAESENWIMQLGYALPPLPDRACEDTHKWDPEPYEYKYWYLQRVSESMGRIVTNINKILDLIKIEHEKVIEDNLIQKKLPNIKNEHGKKKHTK